MDESGHPGCQQKVLFRADGSSQIGTGHLVRCATLANELAARGTEVHLVCRPSPDLPRWSLERFPGTVHQLGQASSPVPDDGEPVPHADWLETSQRDDASQVQALIDESLDGITLDWIVVDHYGLDARWHRSIRDRCRHLLAIDDLADRFLEVDVLLDQNRDPDVAATDYASIMGDNGRLLAGPNWALLRDEFRAQACMPSERGSNPRRLLVVMGGSDPKGLTETVVGALDGLNPPLEIIVVLGDERSSDRIQGLAAVGGHTVDVRVAESDMATLMSGVDVAISAAGSTVWELCCMGVPMALIAEEVNQAAVVAQAVHAGAAVQVPSLDGHEIREVLDTMMRDSARLKLMASAGQALVDGKGAGRVCDIMLAE